ncbi:MAG: peroxiredoxin [Acidobacteriaceae bacterium]|jgi:peroxiredoxin Q/BCP|nr:peroxiredoxin [Acidobacteriaceae bacterium]
MRLLSIGRVVATSATVVMQGIVNVVTRRVVPSRVSLGVGDVAPAFELSASDGKTYRLSDFRGRSVVVLAWFPAAFTGGCTIECRSIHAHETALEQFEVVVFGASVDDPSTLSAFADAFDLRFPMLGDTDRAVARAYGVLGASGLASRVTFYIGLDGRIVAVDRTGATATHGASIEQTLRQLGIPRRPAASAAPALTS